MAKFPQGALDDVEPSVVQKIVTSLKELHDMGKPKTDNEVAERIDEYFAFCANSSIRPGIESLSMSLHIDRTTLFKWSKGLNCSKERQEIIQSAKSFISAYIEQAIPDNEGKRVLTAAELPKLGQSETEGIAANDFPKLGVIEQEYEE